MFLGGPETTPSDITPPPTTCAVKLEPVGEDASGPAASITIAAGLAPAAGRLIGFRLWRRIQRHFLGSILGDLAPYFEAIYPLS